MHIANTLMLVTGGASGAGKAVASRLIAEGAEVILMDIDPKTEAIANSMGAIPLEIDITQGQEVEKVLTTLVSNSQYPFRAAINCAGIAPASRITGKEGPKPLDFFEKVINVNLVGTFNVMRVAAFLMSQSKPEGEERGVIINTASIAAYDGQIGQTAYSASKAGIVGMTLPAARELASFGIRVMTIAPGLIDTPMLQGLPSDIRKTLEGNTPFPKRFAQPDEFASLVEHIIGNPMLNGEVIRLDGALRMQP